jgi:hypothetical protein
MRHVWMRARFYPLLPNKREPGSSDFCECPNGQTLQPDMAYWSLDPRDHALEQFGQ